MTIVEFPLLQAGHENNTNLAREDAGTTLAPENDEHFADGPARPSTTSTIIEPPLFETALDGP